MTTIAVQFTGIEGESTIKGHEMHVEAFGIRESIEAGIGSASRGGRGRHSDIELIRYKDIASPKLSEACSGARNLGTSTIRLFQTSETGAVVFMEYELSDTYVSRIEHETLDESNYAFLPHLMAVTRGLPTPGGQGLASALEPAVSKAAATSRLVPLGTGPAAGTTYTNREVERVFLNTNAITWTYTPYVAGIAGGAVRRGFNLRTSTPV